MMLAGCSDGDDDAAPTVQECETDGLVLNETQGVCVAPPPVATVTLEGLPDTVQAYDTIGFQWILDTYKPENHAMSTQARVATESTPADNTTRPEEFGELVTEMEHQNFAPGQSYDAEYQPTEPGTYYFRAYAVVETVHVWSDEVAVQVTEVAPTGETTTVTLDTGAGVQGTDLGETAIAIGDAVVFQNDDLVEHTLTSTTGDPAFEVAVAAGAASDPVDFLVPGTWGYTSDAPQPPTGSIRVTV